MFAGLHISTMESGQRQGKVSEGCSPSHACYCQGVVAAHMWSSGMMPDNLAYQKRDNITFLFRSKP